MSGDIRDPFPGAWYEFADRPSAPSARSIHREVRGHEPPRDWPKVPCWCEEPREADDAVG